jgi:hypothetical protein
MAYNAPNNAASSGANNAASSGANNAASSGEQILTNDDDIIAQMLNLPTLPYPGLRPFLCDERVNEAAIFFGRSRATDEVIDCLGQSHLVAVVGPSGCGKSSLIRAGVIPGLETGLIDEAGSRWRTTTMLPGHDPLRATAEALEKVSDAPGSFSRIFSMIGGTITGLSLVMDTFPKITRDGDYNLLLLIDQFEETFAPHLVSAEARDNFIRLILEHYRNPHPKLYIILTMRSDFIGDCARFSGFAEALNRTHYITPVLNQTELRQAIWCPAEAYGGTVDDDLIDVLVQDVGIDSAYDPDHLPLVQHALMWMWILETRKKPASTGKIRLELATYQAMGGLTGALDNHIADVLNRDLKESVEAPAQNEAGSNNSPGTVGAPARSSPMNGHLIKDREFKAHDGKATAASGNGSGRSIAIIEIMIRRIADVEGVNGVVRRWTSYSDILTVCQERLDDPMIKLADIYRIVEVFARNDAAFLRKPDSGLTPESLISVGHECFLRRPALIRSWVEAEAADKREYLRLADETASWQAEKNEEKKLGLLLQGARLDLAMHWWKRYKPGPVWAQRYQNSNYNLVKNFYDDSVRNKSSQSNKKNLLRISGVALIVLSIFAIFMLRHAAVRQYWATASEMKSSIQTYINIAHRGINEVNAAILQSKSVLPLIENRWDDTIPKSPQISPQNQLLGISAKLIEAWSWFLPSGPVEITKNQVEVGPPGSGACNDKILLNRFNDIEKIIGDCSSHLSSYLDENFKSDERFSIDFRESQHDSLRLQIASTSEEIRKQLSETTSDVIDKLAHSIAQIEFSDVPSTAIAFDIQGIRVAVGYEDLSLRLYVDLGASVWKPATMVPSSLLTSAASAFALPGKMKIQLLEFSPDRRYLAFGLYPEAPQGSQIEAYIGIIALDDTEPRLVTPELLPVRDFVDLQFDAGSRNLAVLALDGKLVIINAEDSTVRSTLDLPKSMANVVPIRRPSFRREQNKSDPTAISIESSSAKSYIFSTLGHSGGNGFMVAGFQTKVSSLNNIEILEVVQNGTFSISDEAIMTRQLPWQLQNRYHSEWLHPDNVLPVNLFFTQSGKALISIGTDDAIRRWYLQDQWIVQDPVRSTIGITAGIGDKCLADTGLPGDRRLVQESFDAAAMTMINVDRHLDCSGRLLSVWSLNDPNYVNLRITHPSNPRGDKAESYYFTYTVDRIALSPNGDYFLTSSGNHVSAWQTRSGAGSERLNDARLVSELCTRLQVHFGSALNGSDDDPQLSNLRKTCQAYSK